MSEKVIQNLKNILARRRLTPDRASLLCGLDRSYFRKLFDRSVGSPKGATLEKIAVGLEVSMEEILGGSAARAPSGQALNLDTFVSTPAAFPSDIPIMGTAAGSLVQGAFQLTPDVIGYARRPPGLIGATGVYGLYVEGDSMYPQWAHSTFLLVNPHKPVSIDDGVVIQTRNGEHSPIESTLGIYAGSTAEKISIKKHNPRAVIEFNKSFVVAIHKVLTPNEILGV